MDGMQELHRRHTPFRHALPMRMLSGERGEGLEAQWEAQWEALMRHSAEHSTEAYAVGLAALHEKIAKHNADQARRPA